MNVPSPSAVSRKPASLQSSVSISDSSDCAVVVDEIPSVPPRARARLRNTSMCRASSAIWVARNIAVST